MRSSLDVSAVPANPAGAGRYILEIGTRLDWDVIVSRRNDAQRWQRSNGNVQVIAAAPQPRPQRLAWEQLMLPRLLKSNGIEQHLGPHYTVPRMSSMPRVVTVHDMTFFTHPQWHERSKVKMFRSAIKYAAKNCRIIAVSEHTRRDVLAQFPSAQVTTIPLGVNHDVFNTNDNDDATMLAKVKVDGPYVLFVGTVEPRKDVTSLLVAFDRIASAHPDLRLVIAGQMGWGSATFDAALAGLANRDRVQLLGYVENTVVPALLRNATAVAYPSLFEGFGLPALEALACGAPLVTTRGTPMEEVVGDAAVLIDPGDVGQMADVLDGLIAAPDLWRKKGPAQAAQYTWERTAEAHRQLLGI